MLFSVQNCITSIKFEPKCKKYERNNESKKNINR